MVEEKNITIEDLLEKNQRLNKNMKYLNERKDALVKQVRELEKEIKQLRKAQGASKFLVKKKGITVMFIELAGFKNIKEGEDAELLYDKLDEIYIKFDEIIRKHKLERIKTIGDDYICAGGIKDKRSTNPVDICLAALEIRNYIENLKAEHLEDNDHFWNLRIGIHSGNGTVEEDKSKKKKTSYGLTGEVINTVPRIASMCEVGQIHLSDYTYEIVKGYFLCEYSGDLPVKYRGSMALYKLNRIRKQYSEDRKVGIVPNSEFTLRYHLKQFNDLEDKVIEFLIDNLPEHLYYHDYTHTIDVVNQVELIGYGEGVSDHQILLLKTAALFHDTGHTIESKGHEAHSCVIAREWLTEYNYSEEQIEEICSIIMATEMPPNPQNLLQRIMCDSDLDYLGRTDFIPTSNKLFKELEAMGIMSDSNVWNKLQIQFLTAHSFYTETSNRLREVNKQAQIERIQKLIVED
ncbi:MAG: adenylate/guanylate cyclase domain-containing protein [Crocinitomicaceae bacterium]